MRRSHSKEGYADITDISANLLSEVSRVVPCGSVKIDVDNSTAIAIYVEKHGKKISLDISEPNLLITLRDENNENISIFDKLKIAKEFAHKLTKNGLTLSVLRNGKDALTLGEEAKPTLSRIITRSEDIQVDSVMQSSKLRREL
ncbi:MAG TPA: hypothetical protein VE130_04230 [Nitrososphaeraceae archaeon]|jgi:hypothetical protein|nr:hypothetical protein [Nitrososphaeraceae archaeon]